ncbi:MAG: hypothetical protein GYB68_02940 [Chloroflexi bacterium]|nr:hypothetical protein [Chloroflexota bacterium]
MMWGQVLSDLLAIGRSQLQRIWQQLGVPSSYRDSILGVLSPRPDADQPRGQIARLPMYFMQQPDGEANQIVVTAWEMLYMAAYMVDKVIDEHQPDSAIGTGIKANLAVGFLIGAFQLLNTLDPTPANIAIQDRLSEVVVTMSAAHHQSIIERPGSLGEAWTLAQARSGAFFAVGCWCGLRADHADRRLLAQAEAFGMHLGMLLQISNEMGDLYPTRGKRSDIARSERLTLPMIYALSVLPDEQRSALESDLTQARYDNAAEDRARQAILDSGAALYFLVESKRRFRAAQSQLGDLPLLEESTHVLQTLLDAFTLKL